jgi:uncharacterized protein
VPCPVRSELVAAVEELVRLVMPEDPVHGFGHVARVLELACRFAEGYSGVDYEVLQLAALLHDVGRVSGVENHAARSAQVARALLKLAGYPEDRIERVVEAIVSHSYSHGRRAESLEARILSDADKVDALGAIGLVRVFMYSGTLGRGLEDSLDHIRSKILRLPQLLYTEEARREAEGRVRLVVEFLENIERELGRAPELSTRRPPPPSP